MQEQKFEEKKQAFFLRLLGAMLNVSKYLAKKILNLSLCLLGSKASLYEKENVF